MRSVTVTTEYRSLYQWYFIIFRTMSHLFIKKMFIKNPEETLECIPNNEEKYISFRKEIVLCHITDEEGERKPVKREIRFIDSFRFMPTSLDENISDEDYEHAETVWKEFGVRTLGEYTGLYNKVMKISI